MLIWLQDETGFIYVEQHKCISYEKKSDEWYMFFADDRVIGNLKTQEECDRVLRKIVLDFRTGQVECCPW